MSRSNKDRVNYFKHHEVPSSPYAMEKGKHRVAEQDVPQDVKSDPVYFVPRNVGLRHGNNRNYEVELKRARAKKDRLHTNQKATDEVQEYLD
jgi:hypothetical protein